MFKIDAQGKFKCLTEGFASISEHDGKHVMGISQGEEDIDIAPDWESSAGETYDVRLTKSIIFRSRISCEFLVWFLFPRA